MLTPIKQKLYDQIHNINKSTNFDNTMTSHIHLTYKQYTIGDISFNENSIINTSTQNLDINMNSSVLINHHIEPLLALI